MNWIKTKAGLQMAETIIRQLPKIANNKENSIDKYEEDLLKVIEEIDGLKQSVINLSFRIRKLESKENIIGEVRYMER
jgi:ubiquinone biosynthesis protein UbiJ|tara:strand:+ start:256 stop:489 length:234 start_codon:yes stop_codon:yes gene_type:complete